MYCWWSFKREYSLKGDKMENIIRERVTELKNQLKDVYVTRAMMIDQKKEIKANIDSLDKQVTATRASIIELEKLL